MKKVLMFPSASSKNNKYLNNLCDTVTENYEIVGYDEAIKNKTLFKCDIYHFNWYESIDSKKTSIKRKIFIRILKLLNKKIVWTVHNNFPHEINKNKSEIIKFMEFMAKKSEKIHILCKDTVNNKYLEKYKEKIVCIPHGDYIGNYSRSEVDIYKRYRIDKSKKIMLFIGQIRKYKNIEILIKAFYDSKMEQEFVLLICGNCTDEKYQKELKNLSNENVFFDFNFIKDEELEGYLNASQIIVAPYNKESSLNSGTLWMAMSYHKTMMLPLIGCVKDIENYNDYLYVYDYDNEEEHYDKLLITMKRLINDLNKSEDILLKKGNKSYEYMTNIQSWKKQKQNWINLYKF